MRKIILICLLLFIVAGTIVSCGQKSSPESDFHIAFIDGGANVEILNYRGNSQIINIPSKIQKRPVTEIRRSAFCGVQKSLYLTQIRIPNSVKTIDSYSFCCNRITSITIGRGVQFSTRNEGWGYSDETVGWREFENFYRSNNQQAGTYTRRDSSSREWSLN